MAAEKMPAEWRSCKQFPEYEVSSEGQVRKAGRLRAIQIHPYGYSLVYITAKPKQLKLYVHRLVAEAFLAPPLPGQTDVDHIDGDKGNNHVANLRWLSHQENAARRRPRGSIPTARELQRVGKQVQAALDVDARRRRVESGDKASKPLPTLSVACGPNIPTGSPAA